MIILSLISNQTYILISNTSFLYNTLIRREYTEKMKFSTKFLVSIISFILLSKEVCTSSALPPFIFGKPAKSTILRHAERMHYGQIHGFEALKKFDNLQDDCPDVKEDYFVNKVDHFSNDTRTYKQRYQYNSKYYQKSSTADNVFIMIGGEGAASCIWVQKEGYQYIQMAKNHSAYIYQLEHRFFGPSQPFGNTNSMSFDNLKYLHSKQALADLAAFIDGIKGNFVNPKFVVFGGSYPGGLAAIFRLKYPDYSVGGIASSAGINLQIDYNGYSMGMQDTIKATSMDCYNAVNSSFMALQQATLSKDGRAKLNQLFNLQPPFNESTFTQLDLTNFLANVFSVFQGVIQYTYDGRNDITKSTYTVNELCKYMTGVQTSVGYENIAAVIRWSNKIMGGNANDPFPNSYGDMITQLRMVNYGDAINNDNVEANLEGRGWMWLCCNQLGFFQTTDQGRNIWQNIIPLDFFVNQCSDIFDPSVNYDYIVKAVAAGKEYYGDVSTYNAPNTVLPNGGFDPWNRIGVYRNDSSIHLYSFLIPGAAHCSDMYPSYDGEPAGLAPARQLIYNEVNYYLQPKVNIETTTKGTSSKQNLTSYTILLSFMSLLISFIIC